MPIHSHRTKRYTLIYCAVLVLCYALVIGLRDQGYSVQDNISDSVPLGLYVTTPVKHIKPGMIVALPAPAQAVRLYQDRSWFPHKALLLKIVAAMAGDQVCVQGKDVVINGDPVAHITGVDGNQMPMFVDKTCGVLTGQQLYLLNAKHDNSFDSRYYGPVKVADVYARARAL